MTCGHNIHVNYAETEENNPKVMNEMVQNNGVQVVRWTDQELAAFEQAWREVIEENSATDPDFKKVANSYLAFREKHKVWGDAQALKATYLSQ